MPKICCQICKNTNHTFKNCTDKSIKFLKTCCEMNSVLFSELQFYNWLNDNYNIHILKLLCIKNGLKLQKTKINIILKLLLFYYKLKEIIIMNEDEVIINKVIVDEVI